MKFKAYIYIYMYVCIYVCMFTGFLIGTSSIKNLIVFYLAAKEMGSGGRSAILSMLIAKLPRKTSEMLEWLEKKPIIEIQVS